VRLNCELALTSRRLPSLGARSSARRQRFLLCLGCLAAL
jgi:hypothetical protein